MKLKIVTFFVCALALLGSCSDGNGGKTDLLPDPDPVPEPAPRSRTVLVYIAADNSLGSPSYNFAAKDLDEMKEGIKNVDTSLHNLLVYIDDVESAPRLIRLENEDGVVTEHILKFYEEQNSVDLSVMENVFKDAFTSYPGETYGVVFWSHGDGWLPYPRSSTRWWGQDTSNGDHRMNIPVLHTALKSAGVHFEYIFFDACYMQSIEVAYELRDCADYFISSPTEIPGPGAPYQKVVPYLFAADNLAPGIAGAYFNYYNDRYNGGEGLSNDNWTGGVLLSVMKSDALESFAAATREVLSATIKNGEQMNTENVLCYDPLREGNYNDLGGFIKEIAETNLHYTAWKASYDDLFTYRKSTAESYCTYASGYGKMVTMEGASGVATYIPRTGKAALNKAYHDLDWYKAAGWDETGW